MGCCACNGQCCHTGPCTLCYKHLGNQSIQVAQPIIVINPTITIL
jgi:hypothetical protein